MSEYIMEYLQDTTCIEREEIVRCRDCWMLVDDNGKLLCSATMCYVPGDGYCWMGKHHTQTYG